MVSPNRIPIVLSLVLAVSIPAASTAEESPPPGHKIHRSIPPPGAKTHVVILGERFRAGGFKRWLYGSDYRNLWATPIEVTVLDLDRVGRGLTLEKTPCNRVDARAYLKARLMDFLINDRDRHYGQWRWARFPAGDCHTWLPIPEDRDQAFVDFDGFGMAVARRGLPMQIEFDDAYPSLVGLSTTGWELDRQFLVELNKAAWDSVVTAFRRDLPDPVIEDAVRQLPPPYYKIVGGSLTNALKARRDALPQFARQYYALITREAEIQATDQDEYAHCEHLPSGDLLVRIGLIEEPDGAPYFQRTFHPQETREVRIYLRGGADRAEIAGGKGQIAIRIDGGGGADAFTNSSRASAAKTRFYDYRGKNRFAKSKDAKIDERPYKRPPARILRARYALDWGMQAIAFPILIANPDLSVFVGGFGSRQYFGYRKDPFSFGAASRNIRLDHCLSRQIGPSL